MAAIVFDTGGLIALDRGDREIGALLALAAASGVEAVTSSACVAQAWRDQARQARLARALAGFLERPLSPAVARGCGRLLAAAGTSDVVNAAVALLVEPGDTVVTSDPEDIGRLLDATGTGTRTPDASLTGSATHHSARAAERERPGRRAGCPPPMAIVCAGEAA